MKVAVIVARIILGLMFAFASVSYFLHLFPAPEMKGDALAFQQGIDAAVYLMPLVKAIELLCAVCFLTNRYTALATLVIFPILININGYHAVIAPATIALPLILMLADLFLAWTYRKYYQSIFVMKPII